MTDTEPSGISQTEHGRAPTAGPASGPAVGSGPAASGPAASGPAASGPITGPGGRRQVSVFIEEEEQKAIEKSTGYDSDDETLLHLGKDTGSTTQHNFIEMTYLSRCTRLGVVPVGIFLRACASGASLVKLRNHMLGPRGATALAAPLRISPTIVELDLAGCDIQVSGLQHLVHGLIENASVEKLCLAENSVTSTGMKHIRQLMFYNHTITSLDLSGNNIDDKAAANITNILNETSTLKHLDISHNQLGNDTANVLGPALGSNESLSSLDISWNLFRFRGVAVIAKGLKENVRLHKLNLSYNGVGLVGVKALADMLTDNSSLCDLDLCNTNLVDMAAITLGRGLQANEGIERINVSHNALTTLGAYGLLQELVRSSENITLRHVELQGVTVDSKFNKLVLEIQQNNPEFSVIHEALHLVRNISPLDKLYRHLLVHGLSPADLFLIEEASVDKMLTKEQFSQLLLDGGVPLKEEEVLFLADYLAYKDGGVPRGEQEVADYLNEDKRKSPDLSLIYDRWPQYKDSHRHIKVMGRTAQEHENL